MFFLNPFGAEQSTMERNIARRLAIQYLGELHFGIRLRGWYLNRSLRGLHKPTAILEVGCSYGQMSFWLRKRFPKAWITSLDINALLVQHCERVAKELSVQNMEFVEADVVNYKSSKLYDLIVCFDVLEHIPNWREALIHLSGLVRPGGYLLLHTPHKGKFQSPRFGLRKWFRSSGLGVMSSEHVREGFEPEDFDFLKSLEINHIVNYTFGSLTMWLHTFFEIYRSHSWVWRILFTPPLFALGIIDSFLKHRDGGGVLLKGTKTNMGQMNQAVSTPGSGN